jgi:predicted GNAT family acetyltransferase
MDVRRATIADLDGLVEGNAAMALETEGLALDRAVLREGVRALLEARVPGAYYVGEVDGRCVAQLMITFEWSDWRNAMVWWIQSVWVPPAERRNGYYRELYAHVREASIAAGAAGIRLYVDARNTRAQAVYAALGMNGDHYRVFEAMVDY